MYYLNTAVVVRPGTYVPGTMYDTWYSAVYHTTTHTNKHTTPHSPRPTLWLTLVMTRAGTSIMAFSHRACERGTCRAQGGRPTADTRAKEDTKSKQLLFLLLLSFLPRNPLTVCVSRDRCCRCAAGVAAVVVAVLEWCRLCSR